MAETAKAAPSKSDSNTDEMLASAHILSGDIIIGLIGYAGAGCTDVYKRLDTYLTEHQFEVHYIKMSDCIASRVKNSPPKANNEDGKSKLVRATTLQDLGDSFRETFGGEAVASLAIRQIKDIRTKATDSRKAIIVDSIKHQKEVELFRIVYENSFRLVGVYCGNDLRMSRLQDKFYGADPKEIAAFMRRDEKDPESKLGQQVRKAFHHADFFLDNNQNNAGHQRDYDQDLERFAQIMEGGALIRPKSHETAMYHAYAASLRSSCMSRQVGSAITNQMGELLTTGTNEVPAFKGGVYHDSHIGEANRCFKWEWWKGLPGNVPKEFQLPCCHNTRNKNNLKSRIAHWLGGNLPSRFADMAFPPPKEGSMDVDGKMREHVASTLTQFLNSLPNIETDSGFLLDEMPGIGDLIEFSRSIHAEMDALMNAVRLGISVQGGDIFVTAYPCHNCARHLVAAGIRSVRFLEPYDKSLAISLHSDSIENEGSGERAMSIVPYTGVGPRVYEQYFLKRVEVKDERTGFIDVPDSAKSRIGVRLLELESVEKLAIDKVPDEAVIET